jgi:hypothetical protein
METIRKEHATYRLTALQTEYSLVERDVERKPCARYKLVSKRNSGFLATKQRQMKPLTLGLRALKSF